MLYERTSVFDLKMDQLVPAYKNSDDNHLLLHCVMTFDRNTRNPRLFKFPNLSCV